MLITHKHPYPETIAKPRATYQVVFASFFPSWHRAEAKESSRRSREQSEKAAQEAEEQARARIEVGPLGISHAFESTGNIFVVVGGVRYGPCS